MTRASSLGIDPGLLDRFRRAGTQLTWESPVPQGSPRRPSTKVRFAKLNEDRARVEESGRGARYRLTVDSGPVGALVVLLACANRGEPNWLHPKVAGELPNFPMGAIDAGWGATRDAVENGLKIADLVGLARYALA